MIKLIKLLVPLTLLVGIPIVWWRSLDELEGTRAIVMASGASLFGIGFVYKLFGSFDLIPNWIPILGSLDDWMAWMLMLTGGGAVAVAYYLL